jgi:hypothetical protein
MKLYKLGPKGESGSFHNLPHNESLLPGEIKPLTDSPTLKRFVEGGGVILITDEKDFEKYKAQEKIKSIYSSLAAISNDGVSFLDIILLKGETRKDRNYSWRYFAEEKRMATLFSAEEFFESCQKTIYGIKEIKQYEKQNDLHVQFYLPIDLNTLEVVESALNEWKAKEVKTQTNREAALIYILKADHNYIVNPVKNGTQYGKLYSSSQNQHTKMYNSLLPHSETFREATISELINILPELTAFPNAHKEAEKMLLNLKNRPS